MDDLRESLIKATISEGAANPSNKRFSTKAIAARCSVSEFMLFSLFKTKENLLDGAIEYVLDDLVATSQKATLSSRSLEDFCGKLVYRGFEKPEYVIFWANYGYWMGNIQVDEEKRQGDRKRILDAARSFQHLHPTMSDEDVILAFSFLVRHIIFTVEAVYDGISKDSPAYRAKSARLMAGGLDAFMKQEKK
jgi:AcrR family transcriptional regulator